MDLKPQTWLIGWWNSEGRPTSRKFPYLSWLVFRQKVLPGSPQKPTICNSWLIAMLKEARNNQLAIRRKANKRNGQRLKELNTVSIATINRLWLQLRGIAYLGSIGLGQDPVEFKWPQGYVRRKEGRKLARCEGRMCVKTFLFMWLEQLKRSRLPPHVLPFNWPKVWVCEATSLVKWPKI